MNPRAARHVAVGVAIVAVASAIVTIVAMQGIEGHRPLGQIYGEVALATVYPLLGALLLWRRPDNRCGLVFCLPVTLSLLLLGQSGYDFAASTGRLDSPIVDIAAWLAAWAWAPTFQMAPPLIFLLLPTGRPLGRFTGRVVRVVLANGAIQVAVHCFTSDPTAELPAPNPLSLGIFEPIVPQPLQAIGFGITLIATLIGVGSLIVRFRRSVGVERQQLKWITFGATLAPLLYFNGLGDGFDAAGFAAGTLIVPVTAAVAILRYRLFDLDRLVSRTVSYAVLTALLAAPYLLVVGLTSRLAGGAGDLGVALATLAAAAAFNPLRQRVQVVVDRRFNRSRYDAARTIDAFSARLRDEVDLESLRGDLLDVVSATMQPASASLWLRPERIS